MEAEKINTANPIFKSVDRGRYVFDGSDYGEF